MGTNGKVGCISGPRTISAVSAHVQTARIAAQAKPCDDRRCSDVGCLSTSAARGWPSASIPLARLRHSHAREPKASSSCQAFSALLTFFAALVTRKGFLTATARRDLLSWSSGSSMLTFSSSIVTTTRYRLRPRTPIFPRFSATLPRRVPPPIVTITKSPILIAFDVFLCFILLLVYHGEVPRIESNWRRITSSIDFAIPRQAFRQLRTFTRLIVVFPSNSALSKS
jgi:hypothetical protein